MAKGIVKRILAGIEGLGRRRDQEVVGGRADGFVAAANAPSVFGTLTMPNGQVIKTMREDAFQAALVRSGNKTSH